MPMYEYVCPTEDCIAEPVEQLKSYQEMDDCPICEQCQARMKLNPAVRNSFRMPSI